MQVQGPLVPLLQVGCLGVKCRAQLMGLGAAHLPLQHVGESLRLARDPQPGAVQQEGLCGQVGKRNTHFVPASDSLLHGMCIPVAVDDPLNPCKCLGSCRITRLLPLPHHPFAATSRGPLLFRAVLRVLPHSHRQLVWPPPPHISTATDVGWYCVSFVAVTLPRSFTSSIRSQLTSGGVALISSGSFSTALVKTWGTRCCWWWLKSRARRWLLHST